MRTRYGSPTWIADYSGRRPEYPRLRGKHQADVLVVGGGLTGCATAYALGAAGIRCTLIEADRIGQQGAGRAAGLVSADAAPAYGPVEAALGRRTARAMFEASRRASLDLAAAIRRLSLKVRYEPRQALLLRGHGDGDAALRREVAARRGASLDATLLARAALAKVSSAEADGAIRLRDWAQLDPYRLTLGFAAAAVSRGVEIFERTRARRITVGTRHAEAHIDGGVIAAETIIFCTHEPGPLFKSLQRHLRTAERYVVLTEPMPTAMRKSLGPRDAVIRDEGAGLAIGWTPDDRILLAGGDQPRLGERARAKALVQRTGQLMYELLRRYPSISGLMPAAGWHVPLSTAADGVMYAGPHRNYPRHLFAWGTGHDPAHAFLASRILLRHVTGEPHRDDSCFAFARGSHG